MPHPIDAATLIADSIPSTGFSTATPRPVVLSRQDRSSSRAKSTLQAAVTGWFVVAGLGQLMFVAYLFGFYGRTAVLGRFEAWNQVFPTRPRRR